MNSDILPVAQIIEFIMELDKLKGIIRKTRPQHLKRLENSAEHSWQVATAALMLKEYARQPVDINHVIKMLLIHDIGEIDAGDVIAYAANDPDHQASERAGIVRIFNMLPDDMGAEYLVLWDEFEAAETPEAKYAKAIDRALPMLHNLFDQGRGWRTNRIHRAQIDGLNKPIILDGCPALWDFAQPRLDDAVNQGWFNHTNEVDHNN